MKGCWSAAWAADTKLFDVALITPDHVLRLRWFGDGDKLPNAVTAKDAADFTH